ncbi:MAG TPA: penicillin-binding transpeptidase domain-containing protein [Frankiaceae bacterium]|nr:penicillin-binding transpeptidase domain-containing protein [Frankiaceae bacterium]
MVLTSGEQAKTGLRRPVSAKWLIVVLAVLLVAGGGAVVLLTQKVDPRTDQARGAVSAYLAAWSRGDYAAMAEHANVPETRLQSVLAPIASSLKAEKSSYTAGQLTRKDDTATAPFTADLALSGLGQWGYDGTQQVVRGQDKVWRVQFGPSAVHPQMTNGSTIKRVSTLGKRGRLLDRNGTVLRGADADLDGNLLGTVGTLDAAQAAAAGTGYAAGDRGGQSGLERAYNARLAGTPGAHIVLARGSGATVVQAYPAKNGTDIRTTLDLRYQQAARSGISGFGSAGLVAIDTKTGGVLAASDSGGAGTAIRGQYPPGSTFKIVTTTAGLLHGLDESTPLNCPATVYAGGRSFKNANDEAFGPINLRQAFYHSCNTAFVNLRSKLSDADMQRAATLFGFDGKQPLPIESFGGVYPTGAGHDPYAEAFGQDKVEASPLQMASVAAGVAGGTWHRPFLVDKAPESHPLPANVASQMRDMMRAVVTEGTAAPVSFPGEVSGKTGTAEYGSGVNGGDPPTHAWFAGFRGDVAFAVLVPGGGFGAEVAAPAAARFLRALDASGG